MALNGFSQAVRLPGGPEPEDLPPVTVDLGDDKAQNVHIDPNTGAQSIELGDGSVVINLNPQLNDKEDSEEFFENLADSIDKQELAKIAEDLLQGIDADDKSRATWLQTRARGIELLGLKLEQPRTEVGSAPLEGMSTVRHPLLLEATLRFQANARGELLPANGPVKVRDDDDTGGSTERDELAQALEIDFNHFLTDRAPEYYPDTDRMLFYVGWGGVGFKKVYTCPIRRRPTSESVDAKDLIVSDAVTDLRNAGRVTHRIMMRPSVLKRMQMVGAYRDITLHQAPPPDMNAVDRKIAETQGLSPEMRRPEDRERELYECYCELDIPGFRHLDDNDKATGLPLPYRVTLDKDSRHVLAVVRNWDEDDDQCLALQTFVKYPFVAGLGFYDIGLIHILGNATIALTAAWREMLDAGMFASFPGGLMARQIARQETNEFRVAPGSFVPIETGGQPISEVVMPLPYKDVSSGLLGLTESINTMAQRVGGTAEMAVGEGTQEAPVGTTLALIEQATKVMDAVHKRIHAAQAEEFKLLKREFQKDPTALWRGNRKSAIKRVLGIDDDGEDVPPEKLLRFTVALNDTDLVPAADPNSPSEVHRLMKATALIQLMQMSQTMPEGRLDPRKVIEHALRIMRVGGDMFAPPPDPSSPPPPDPKVQQAIIQAQTSKDKIQIAGIQAQSKMAEIQAKERMSGVDLQRDMIGHQTAVAQSQDNSNPMQMGFERGGAVMDQAHERSMAEHDQEMAHHDERMTIGDIAKTNMEHEATKRQHDHDKVLAQRDIEKAMLTIRAKQLDIEKAKIAAKKPKPKATKK